MTIFLLAGYTDKLTLIIACIENVNIILNNNKMDMKWLLLGTKLQENNKEIRIWKLEVILEDLNGLSFAT